MDGAPQGGDRPDATGSPTPPRVAPETRQWRHPSELGHQSRVAADRRRGHRMVLGLVISGVGILVATAAIASHLSTTPPQSGPLADASPTSSSATADDPDPGSTVASSGAVWVGLRTVDNESVGTGSGNTGTENASTTTGGAPDPDDPDQPGRMPGALVMAVEPDSPAEHGGIAVGDLVVSVDEAMVHTGTAMQEHVDEHVPGDEVRFGIVREDQLHSMTVVVTAPR